MEYYPIYNRDNVELLTDKIQRITPEGVETVEGEESRNCDVIIYSTSWCGACDRAKAHLDERGVAYVDKDIEDDAAAEEEFLEKSGGRRGVPLLDVYGQIMHGFSPARLDQMLQRRS